jgi:type I restriction enzyme S subunit
MKINIGNDLYLKGRIGWKGLSKDEYLEESNFRIINGYSLKDGYIDWNIAGYISEDRYEESPEIKLEINDILISKDGTIGKVGIVRNLVSPTTVASGIFVLRNIIKDKLDTEYLFQFLKSSNFKAFINAVKASGSTIIHLYQRDLAKLELEVPHISVQKAISRVLFTIDSKIELNNRINAELESMAKTIYDYWFVQFDFPDKNGKPYKSSGGKMVWNEELKREIPEGWISAELKDIANITMGQSPPGESYNENGAGVIFYQGCTDFGPRFPSIRQYTTDPSRYAKPGDILLSVRAPVGTMNISITECCIGRGLAALNSKDNCTPFLFEVLRNLKQVFDRRNTDGTTFGAITKDDLFSLKVVKPTENVLIEFSLIFQPVFEKQNTIALENDKLSELRDWLLPMLMNGQVKVN